MEDNIVSQLIKDLESNNIEIQKTAAKACFNIVTRELIPALKKATLSESAGLRYFARKSLFNIISKLQKQSPAQDNVYQKNEVLMLLNSNADKDIIHAVRLLGNSEDINEKILDRLLDVLKNSSNDLVISMILNIFSKNSFKKAYNTITEFLKNKDKRIVANAIEALRFYNDSKTIVTITPFLKDDDNRIKANTINVLHFFSVTGIKPELEKMAFSENIWERDSALYAITACGFKEFEDILIKMLKKEQNTEIINKIIFLLKKSESAEARSAQLAFFQKK